MLNNVCVLYGCVFMDELYLYAITSGQISPTQFKMTNK